MVENKPRFRAYWTLKQSTRPCSRKISVQGEIWNALSLRNVVSKAISLWAAGPFPKCERILAPCRLGKDVKVQRGTSTHGMGMAVVSLLVADKAPYGSFDTFSPQWSPSSLPFFFFLTEKKLVKPFLSISSLRELFSTGFYKSCLATFMEVMTHARVVRAVGIFTYTDFIVMLDGCPLL